MRASETLQESQSRLSELLLETECEWHSKTISTNEESGEKKYEFTTTLGEVHITVNERKVSIKKKEQTNEGLMENVRAVENPNKLSELYKSLVKRFTNDKDITFYNEAFGTITEMLEEQERIRQEGEEGTPEDNDGTITLSDSRES